MSDPLYRKEILRLAADAHGAGHLPAPHRTGIALNPTCGDRVRFEIVIDGGGRITALAHETKACVLAQASASILGRNAKTLTQEDLRNLREAATAMLKETAPAPDSPFSDYAAFEGVNSIPARHTCVLLPIDALLKAFDSEN